MLLKCRNNASLSVQKVVPHVTNNEGATRTYYNITCEVVSGQLVYDNVCEQTTRSFDVSEWTSRTYYDVCPNSTVLCNCRFDRRESLCKTWIDVNSLTYVDCVI